MSRIANDLPTFRYDTLHQVAEGITRDVHQGAIQEYIYQYLIITDTILYNWASKDVGATNKLQLNVRSLSLAHMPADYIAQASRFFSVYVQASTPGEYFGL